jgi:hypothetical protein
MLLVGAKIATGKGSKLAILCPDDNTIVAKVLKTARIGDLIPVFQSEDAAVAAVIS